MSDRSEMVHVRYMVDDVEKAVAFYTKFLDFKVLTNFPPAFADVARGNLRLLLSGPTSSAGRPMPDGTKPRPGGWNRIHLIVDDLAANRALLVRLLQPLGFELAEAGGGEEALERARGETTATPRAGRRAATIITTTLSRPSLPPCSR